jgi:hypothetical protein
MTRVNHLRGTLAGGWNGGFQLSGSTVADNSSIDNLFAAAGDDWFWADTSGGVKDNISGKASWEELDEI